MTNKIQRTLAEHAARVVAMTMSAWQIATPSPHEVARRAPHGHVPARALRRRLIEASWRQPLLEYSW